MIEPKRTRGDGLSPIEIPLARAEAWRHSLPS
jgi:hypothetical protein